MVSSRNGVVLSHVLQGGVRFFVQARDFDPSPPPPSSTSLPIIGTLLTVVEISAGSDFTTRTFRSSTFLTITASFRVMCTGNSMGPDCSICREGFQNPASGCTETCTPAQGCCRWWRITSIVMLFTAHSFPTAPVGGFCNAADVCVCREGYSGDSCDIGRMCSLS